MADLQRDALEELGWDLRALEAAVEIGDERLTSAGMIGTAAGLLPSLHLNLADVYARLGEFDRAHEQLRAGRATPTALPHDGYRELIDRGLEGIAGAISQLGTPELPALRGSLARTWCAVVGHPGWRGRSAAELQVRLGWPRVAALRMVPKGLPPRRTQ